ncbi:MAG TPA: hypothetical protein VKY57_07920 [Chitinispirillaceae bacterium]|jgi:hypothetical protein|nr:hypothetical protein [Chitinispirillaceae bacterium]
MKSAVFSNGSDTYQVANVIYAGPVSEIPQEKRKGDSTHSFRMITTQGEVYCNYKSIESAKNSVGALKAMMESLKENVFKTGTESIDTKRIVSFGRVVKLENTENGKTHAFLVNIDTTDEKHNQIWLTYKSEDHADKARKALYAAIHSVNRIQYKPEEDRDKKELIDSECCAEVA